MCSSKGARSFFLSKASFEMDSLEEELDFVDGSEEVDVFLAPRTILSFMGGLDNGVFESLLDFLLGVI